MTGLPEPGCDRGPQRFRFSWSFDRDISQLSGKQGNLAFTVYPKIEGDRGGGCLDLNPFYYPAGFNDMLTRNIRGEGRYYFKPIDEFSQPSPFLFYINPVHAKYPGEYKVTILQGGYAAWAGGILDITYHYEQVSGQPPDDKRAFCDNYSKTAVNQNEENIRRRCGYTGGRWQSNYDNHFGWCMNMNKDAADSETRIRAEDLKRCGGATNVFHNPTHQGYRIDRCWTWGRDCDKPAADRFCRDRGFAGASSWQWEYVRPTYILGTGQICDADFCGGFSLIECFQINR